MNCETYDNAIAGTPFAVLRKLIKIKIGRTFNKSFSFSTFTNVGENYAIL